MKQLLIFIYLLLSTLKLNIFIQKNEFCYYVNNDDITEEVCVNEIIITNYSKFKIYTWIDYEYCSDDILCSKDVMRYFLKPHGDFNYWSLFTDTIVFNEFKSVIGSFFLKIIEPGESFRYIGINNKEIEKHIAYISEFDFERIMGQRISPNALDGAPLFMNDLIVIDSSKKESNK